MQQTYVLCCYLLQFAGKIRWLVWGRAHPVLMVQSSKGRIYTSVSFSPLLQRHSGKRLMTFSMNIFGSRIEALVRIKFVRYQLMLQYPDFILNLTYNLGFGMNFEVWEKNERNISPESKVCFLFWGIMHFLYVFWRYVRCWKCGGPLLELEQPILQWLRLWGGCVELKIS